MYLKWKLENLEENNEDENGSLIKDKKNESSINDSYNNNFRNENKLENEKKEREGIEKLQMFFTRNEEIYQNKINHEQKKIKEKYEKLKKLENFNNPIFQILSSKYKDYQNNMFNALVSNQEIFFNNKNDSGSERMNKVSKRYFNVFIFQLKNSKSMEFLNTSLTKGDKKEIIKLFFEDLDIKKYIYELLYDNQ